MRRLVISLAVLAAVLAAADYGIRLYSESVVGGEVKSALQLSEKPSISFGGWPFITHLISGNLPSASFSAVSFAAHGVGLREVKVSLTDIHFPSGRLLSGGGGTIHAGAGHGSASLTGTNITRTLHSEGVSLTVAIRHGRAFASAQGITVGLTLKLEGNMIVLTPAATTIGATRFNLPSIIRGLHYTSLRLVGQAAVLSFQLRNAVIVVPGA